MALHKQIKEALEQTPRAVITNIEEHIHLPNLEKWPHYEAGLAHVIYFYAAPKETMFTAEALNQFMTTLFRINLTSRQDFREEDLLGTGYLYHGRLEFTEAVGREERGERKVIIFDEELQKEPCFVNGETLFPSEKEDLVRKVIVKVYPDKDIAYFVAKNYELGHSQNDNSLRHLRWDIEKHFKVNEIDLRRGVQIEQLRVYTQNRSNSGFKEK